MIKRKQIPGFTIETISDSDFTLLSGTFQGFEGSSYEGGCYEVTFKIPDQYPEKPPLANFKTKVWHPNISSATGLICMSLLSDKWQFSDNLLTIIGNISDLLVCPEPDDPQDLPVANQFKNNKQLFDQTAAFWNHHYARGLKPEYFEDFTNKVHYITKLGYDKDEAIHALSMKNWNIEEAIHNLSGK